MVAAGASALSSLCRQGVGEAWEKGHLGQDGHDHNASGGQPPVHLMQQGLNLAGHSLARLYIALPRNVCMPSR